ncbi:Kelch-like protein 2 [Microtus ochrogaster]|uniref:Kelch-like protein 2 n=1 Tax=Microtus ochrogaster TaxID=79684 RepID=A0A8J6FZY4_MICOH|nr:Kelch-like protein 2 [Microtus ochrogaster]
MEKPVSVQGTVEVYGSLVQIQDPGRSKRASTFQRNGNCVGWEKHIRAREQTSDVKARVEEEALVKNSSACKDYLIEAMKYHLLPTEQRMLMKSVRTRLRTPMNLPKLMVVVGGQAPKAIRSVECYDFKEERWHQVAELPSRRCRAVRVDLCTRVDLQELVCGVCF